MKIKVISFNEIATIGQYKILQGLIKMISGLDLLISWLTYGTRTKTNEYTAQNIARTAR